MPLPSLAQLDPARFDTPAVLKALAQTSRTLAELKGVSALLPNQAILVNTLGLEEAKDSSEIENIVTTRDELFQGDTLPFSLTSASAKEVLHYRQALWLGFEQVRHTGLLTSNHIVAIQAELECNSAGLRKLPGTELKDGNGQTVYTPPQDAQEIVLLMRDLEQFINDSAHFAADALIKMALIHYQFESIHPFYDGNGRTGRIMNVLYLVKENLLITPILYLSRYILRHKADYYRLLQAVREQDAWEDWVLYMLAAVQETASQTIKTVSAIHTSFLDYKHRIRNDFKFYSQDLINSLFNQPYTKVEFIQRDLGVTRLTATKYLQTLTQAGLLEKHIAKGRHYYVNCALNNILAGIGS